MTYNNLHHQFDSQYNHKWGYHVNYPFPEVLNWISIAKPKVVKVLDFSIDAMREIREAVPDVMLIGRLSVADQSYGRTSEEAAYLGNAFAERILQEEVNRHHWNGNPLISDWESYNEVLPEAAPAHEHRLYNDFQVAFGQRMIAEGYRPIAQNFGTGNGSGEQWLDYYRGTLETYTFLGFHEYDWPTMDRLHQEGLSGPEESWNWFGDPPHYGNDGAWLALRYRRIMDAIRKEFVNAHTVVITECSMTQGVWGGNSGDLGWLHHEDTSPAGAKCPLDEDEYWESLQWYNSELMKDDYVIGACLFVTGASGLPEWDTFEHVPMITKRIYDYQQVEVPTDPDPEPSPDPDPPQETPMATSNFIAGLHDPGGEHILTHGGWVVVTEAIGRDPNDHRGVDYRHLSDRGYGVIVRLNNGYGSTGTIPLPQYYDDFARRCANFVHNSRGAHIWIIGNEPNHEQEWPEGQMIFPGDYATCFKLCRNYIKQGQWKDDQVLLAAPGPWNASVRYTTNQTGDWVQYLMDQIWGVEDFALVDGVALHTYTHGHDPALIHSTATMDPPFQNRYFEFYAYKDFLVGLQSMGYMDKPLYITETNGDDRNWAGGNNGWHIEAYKEIEDWNKRNPRQVVRALVTFRWMEDPVGWSIENRPDIQADVSAAASLGFTWNDKIGVPEPEPPTQPEPPPEPEPEPEPVPPDPPVELPSNIIADTLAELYETRAALAEATAHNEKAIFLLEGWHPSKKS